MYALPFQKTVLIFRRCFLCLYGAWEFQPREVRRNARMCWQHEQHVTVGPGSSSTNRRKRKQRYASRIQELPMKNKLALSRFWAYVSCKCIISCAIQFNSQKKRDAKQPLPFCQWGNGEDTSPTAAPSGITWIQKKLTSIRTFVRCDWTQ